ncbi:MAG: serine hydrolase domain-containing protein [Planctomycetaceae bacterium]
MSLLLAEPEELGIDPDRWEQAAEFAQLLVEQDRVPAIAYQLVRPDAATTPVAWGRLTLADEPSRQPLPTDSLFLTASLSKPIVAMTVLKLVEAGLLSLQDKVCDLLPESAAAPKRLLTVRHLLTHTSGLPDMLPNNRLLRKSQAELDRFVQGACSVTLDFPPGRGVQYQSMGYALLGEIIGRISGMSCRDYVHTAICAPLGMTDTVLGAPRERLADEQYVSRIAEVRVPEDQQEGLDWNWNSSYWRTLGAPWGGVLSTVADLTRFLQMMLQSGDAPGGRLFAPATIETATSNQLETLHDLPEGDRRTRGWGHGWRLNWLSHSAPFGDLLPPQTYGHWGATGTLWWVDPLRSVGLVLLSSQPLGRDDSLLLRLSNRIASSVLE